MKIWQWSAVAFAVASIFSTGCGMSGCGAQPAATATNTPPVTCGAGTAQQGGFCVPTSTPVTH